MSEIIIYTTHCPKCSVLEKKMKQKNIPYREITDISIMRKKDVDVVPILEVDGKMLNYKEANDYINTL